jgi:hypothetical protein
MHNPSPSFKLLFGRLEQTYLSTIIIESVLLAVARCSSIEQNNFLNGLGHKIEFKFGKNN